MSKGNLFKKVVVSAIAAAMCLSMTLSASASASADLKTDPIGISVAKAEWTDTTRSYLSDLQPYLEELQAINEEFGYEIAADTSTEDAIAQCHSEFCSMTIPEFRDYVIDLYNSSYAYYTVPDIEVLPASVTSEQASQSTYATTYDQIIYLNSNVPENYYWLRSTQYQSTTGNMMYDSIEGLGYHTILFPTWRITYWNWQYYGLTSQKVRLAIELTWFLAPNLYWKPSVKTSSLVMTAGVSAYSLNLDDYDY